MNKITSISLLSLLCILLATFRFGETQVSFTDNPSEETKRYLADYNGKFFAPVVEKLKSAKVDSIFLKNSLEDPRLHFSEKLVLINVSGYIKKADYSEASSWYSARLARQFMRENIEVFESAEATYQVPKEAIAAILWIETRAGSYLGSNQLLSVFFSAAMADQPSFIESSKTRAYQLMLENEDDTTGIAEKIATRAKSKADWAIGELIALSQMSKDSVYNISKLSGSWAGAFGMSQFLPSSYLKYAVDGSGDGKIDLFDIEDAVMSVANYLSANGWSYSSDSRKKAVYSYNHSDDYVNGVLSLASKI